MKKNLPIKGIRALSLIDYPGKLAAVVFFGGCNFKCPFCHNYELAVYPERQEDLDYELVLGELERRKKIIDGVVLTGGEPTLYPDLIDFAKQIKAMGLLVKLDTNGYRPDVLKQILDLKIADFVSMDIKSALNEEKYKKAAGIPKIEIGKIMESIALLMNSETDYEFRTSVISQFVSREDIFEIAGHIKGAKAYCLQSANPDLEEFSGPSGEEIKGWVEELKNLGMNAVYK